jgi:hypothetical protein
MKLILVSILLSLLSSSAAAQRATRIRFARGATRADVSGTLRNDRDKRNFIIKVRAGQTIRTEQLRGSHPITIFVADPNGEGVGDSDASCNNRREITPTVAGDYRIKVIECQKADPWRGNFRFRVTVR